VVSLLLRPEIEEASEAKGSSFNGPHKETGSLRSPKGLVLYCKAHRIVLVSKKKEDRGSRTNMQMNPTATFWKQKRRRLSGEQRPNWYTTYTAVLEDRPGQIRVFGNVVVAQVANSHV
jgi:hypothetical protein